MVGIKLIVVKICMVLFCFVVNVKMVDGSAMINQFHLERVQSLVLRIWKPLMEHYLMLNPEIIY